MHDAAVLREILDAQREMVCRFSADGTIRYVNRAYAASLGHTPEDLAGRNLWEFVARDDHDGVGAQMARLTLACPEVTIENRFETAAGPRWTLWNNAALAFDADGKWAMAQSTGIDITERRELEERTKLLIEELNHRVKNMLMVVQSIAYQTFRGTAVPADHVEKFNQRLSALAAAHTALSDGAWVGAPMADLVREATAICERDSKGRPAVTQSGPQIMLSARLTVPLVMVLHELSTNAIKYGALSVPEGQVAVSWAHCETEDRRIALEWRESGGPPVSAPRKTGFGSQLIGEAVNHLMRGDAHIDYAASGLVCRFVISLDDIAA
jgi:PAS domain S-box-containing protein